MDFSNLDYYLDINGLSHHLGVDPGLPKDYRYNEINPGFGLTAEKENNGTVKGLSVGGYKNSFNEPSYYFSGQLAKRFGKDNYLDFGLFGGVATGYKDVSAYHNGREFKMDEYDSLQPMGGLMMNIGNTRLGRIGLKYVPTKEGVIMMNYGIPIK